jgi:acyl-CoA reductase-like NAD-dependent aldehyde dehydrogenase
VTGTFLVENPATGEALKELRDTGPEDVDRAVGAARAAWPDWAARSPRERGRLLHRLADLLEDNASRLAQVETDDNGRPIRETTAQQGILSSWYRYFAGWCDKIHGRTIPVEGPYLNYTERVPVGVCCAITPWNHPLVITTKKVAPALACGNTVLVKPSELAPLSVIELGRLATEAGFPEGVLTVLTGQRDTGQALVAHPGVDRVDVTGSTQTGIAVQRAAAPTMKRLGFELGGKAANIVLDDADLSAAAEGALLAGFVAQGQTCIAGSRLLIQRSVLDGFVDACVGRTRELVVGDPRMDTTQMGPQISAASLERIEGFLDRAEAEGVELLTGGARPSLSEPLSRGNFFTPTILLTHDPTVEVAQEELFGPVITVIPFDDDDEAIAIANGVRYGLGAAVWTGSVDRSLRIARGLRAGTVWVNDYHRVDPASPWGGFGLSGYGRENGEEAIQMFTEVKSTWVRLAPPEVSWYQTSEHQRLN